MIPPRPLATLVLVATALAAPSPLSAARVEADLRVEALGLPERNEGLRELSFAFGKKETAETLRQVLMAALRDRSFFEAVEASGPADFSLELRLSKARSEHADFGTWQSRASSVDVSADASYVWRNSSNEIIAEGRVAATGQADVAGPPRRPDSVRAWTQLLDRAVAQAFLEAYEAAAFGNEVREAAGGWIEEGTER